MEVGQAVVKLQGRSPRPFQIQIPHLKIEKGRIKDLDIQHHMHQIAPAWPQEDFRLPEAQPVKHEKPLDMSEQEEPTVRAFLMDILNNPDSGIAQRYKRLGISVRQGQKIKDRLCLEQFIEESEEISSTGRIKRLILLPKGTRYFDKA